MEQYSIILDAPLVIRAAIWSPIMLETHNT